MVPCDVDHGLVEGVAEGVPGVAADQDGAGLGHEAGHGAGVAGDGDGGALERDPGPQRGVALDEDAARRGRWHPRSARRCP